MTTTATIRTNNSCHWYFTDGRPCYELPKKDGSGMKVPTLADARKLNLLPGVTGILNLLDKPALNDWKVTQGVLAVLTTPRLPGELDDAYVNRVLQVEKVQEQEGKTARDKGTDIHGALEAYFQGQSVLDQWAPWVMPAAEALLKRGSRVTTEKILVGHGYAGRTDLILDTLSHWEIADYKTTKKLPEKGAWDEHVLQLAAYARAWETLTAKQVAKPIRTVNCYISTVDQGKFKIVENDPNWQEAYAAFAHLVAVWQYLKGYKAQQ
jgi:hypothetical protein